MAEDADKAKVFKTLADPDNARSAAMVEIMGDLTRWQLRRGKEHARIKKAFLESVDKHVGERDVPGS